METSSAMALIYSASTGGVRYDLSLPPLFFSRNSQTAKKNADNLLFSLVRSPSSWSFTRRDHDGTSPSPFRELSNKPKPRCKAD